MRTAILPLFALVVGGCSSSGGGGQTSEVAIEPNVAITVDNALDVATAAVRSAFDIERIAYTGARFLLTQPPEPPEPPMPGAPATLGTSLSVELPGPQGGTATFSWQDVQPDGKYSSGDVFSVTLDEYGADDQILNGAMLIDNVRLLGVITPDGVWMVDADLNLLSLTVRIGTQSDVLNLKLPFHLENRVIVEVFEAELTEEIGLGPLILQKGNRMARFENADSINYVFVGAVFSPQLSASVPSGRATEPGGIVTYYTTGTMGGFSFFADPSQGIMIVRGAQGSLLELEAGFFTLTIRIDENGDEEFEDEINTSFTALLPQ